MQSLASIASKRLCPLRFPQDDYNDDDSYNRHDVSDRRFELFTSEVHGL